MKTDLNFFLTVAIIIAELLHQYIDYVEVVPGGWIKIRGAIGSRTYLYYTFGECVKKYNAEAKEANKND